MKRYLLLATVCSVVASTVLAFTASPQPVMNGVVAAVDLPVSQHMKNTGGSDGAGLCVFTSVEQAARWQNVRELEGFQSWMTRRPGGGWPAKLDQMIEQYCASVGQKAPSYIQHTGGDADILDLAIKTGRMPCVTYAGRDDFYKGRIAHMVNLAHLDDRTAAIIDNNRPGVWVWMSRDEFMARWRDMRGGWAVVLLASPPPPHAEPPRWAALGNLSVEQCVNGMCMPGQPLPQIEPVARPVSVGLPPSSRHYWGYFPELGQWGWRLGGDSPPPPPSSDTRPDFEEKPVNYGVDPDRIAAAPRYMLNGVEISRMAALGQLADDAAPFRDDSGFWHLVVVGTPALQRRVREDVVLLADSLRQKLHLQCYAPSHWAVQHFRLPEGVSLREPPVARVGKEVGVVGPNEYSAAALKKLLARPRGPNPDPPVPEPSSGSGWTTLALAALLLLVVYLFSKRA